LSAAAAAPMWAVTVPARTAATTTAAPVLRDETRMLRFLQEEWDADWRRAGR
jgi:hypothetical protein